MPQAPLDLVPQVFPEQLQQQQANPAGEQNLPLPGLGGGQSPLQTGPPKDEAELETRKQGWRGFFEKLRTDKGLQQMMITLGTQLMQPIKPNQSFAGHVGGAVQAGSVARRSQDALEASNVFKTQGLAIEQQKANAASSRARASAKAPAAEVQTLSFLAQAKVRQAAAEGRTLSPEQALLEVEEARRTKAPAELISPLLPFLALTDDPAANQRMLQNILTALTTISGKTAPNTAGTSKVKRQVWDPELKRFVEQ